MALKPTFQNELIEAGCDEAGRGCLAGPVVAAAVILPKGFKSDVLNDSKQLNEKKRNTLRTQIEQEALAWAVVEVGPREIDEINILQASITAMQRALDQLKLRPEFIAVDGNKFKPYGATPYQTVVKGDAKYMNIAAASILAKTHRDEIMAKLDLEHPFYDWKKNKGYPTKAHRQAIKENGISHHHRKSFRLLPEQLTFDF